MRDVPLKRPTLNPISNNYWELIDMFLSDIKKKQIYWLKKRVVFNAIQVIFFGELR